MALAWASLGASGALGAPEGDEPDLWGGDHRGRGRTGAGPLLSAVPGDIADGAAADPSVATSPVDRVLLSDPEAETVAEILDLIWVWLFFDDVHLMISKCGARMGRCVWSD